MKAELYSYLARMICGYDDLFHKKIDACSAPIFTVIYSSIFLIIKTSLHSMFNVSGH